MDALMRCDRCGQEVPPGSRFCPGCGASLYERHAQLGTGMLPSRQRIYDRYVIVQKLAQGGQSAVYLVSDTFDGGRQCVIKEMSESNLNAAEREKAINDFMREAKMLSKLDHPALAKVYDTFVEHQKHFLVMEYVRGHNLEDELIHVGRPLEWARVVGWGSALCDVLSYLHALTPPIIYRDLKPANVMLTPDGAIKLIDFGIARWLHPARTRDTAQLGTDGYAPLEQYSAHSEPRSDLYALGASLYHLLTGHVPESAPLRIAGHSLTPIRSINPQVPETVERVIHRALNLQARERFASAAQMRAALEWSRNQTGPLRASHTTMGPAPRSGRLGTGMQTSAPATSVAIGRASGQSLLPRLHVWPLRLDAGFLEMNDTTVLTLEVQNRGGGQLSGHTETNTSCLTTDPTALDSDITVLRVCIDTTGLAPGPYTCHLAIRTTGGDQIVPVRFIVRPPQPPSIGLHRRTSY